jgi:hypothetical protein
MSELIYKFMPVDRITYLEDEMLRITQPADLNDPFEFLPAPPTKEGFTKVLETLYKEDIAIIGKSKFSNKMKLVQNNLRLREFKTQLRKLRKDEPGNIKEHFLENAAKKINSQIGIISLTRRWDSTLMWSHYTNSHKGFCIGLNSQDSFFSSCRKIDNVDKIFMPVEYSDTRIKVPAERGVSIEFKVVLTKSKDWQYEEEERLLVGLRKADKRIPFKPYDICLYRVPRTLVKEIVLGVNFDNKNLQLIKNFCLDNKVGLYRAKISEESYNMERELIQLMV